ncbi:beta-1,3-galactosyl-O-glycosyl-glycoprotein beta-1,6-N-acetylglucosaminyltransferase-like [Liolophura sinensis]|uniref:beta-1,3-galactosyl-O-glycosyl-glycoprotein beta-1,6-N-acetylglucosaminyltransferase-like n=1 Tax=Liolophura sinensis TaxID=3198878 RepID=UPI0031596318
MLLGWLRRILWGLLMITLCVFGLLSSYTLSKQRLYGLALRQLQGPPAVHVAGLKLFTQAIPNVLSTPKTYHRNERESINSVLQPQRTNTINCLKLFKGDKNETAKSKWLIKSKPFKPVPYQAFINATKRCDLFRVARNYTEHVSDEEESFPLAFSIVIHKSVEQFERLLRALYRPNNYYCVHVDRKASNAFHMAIKSLADCFDNVFVAAKLEVVVYAGFTRLQADINCMQELRQNFSDWKYVLNLAGSEMPLKTNFEMVQILKLYNGTNLVGKNMRALNPWRWKNRYETVVTEGRGHIVKRDNSNTPPPYHLNITKGSAYAVLSRALIDYIFTDPVPLAFLEWSKSTYSPDEQFWATLNNVEHNPGLTSPGGNPCPGFSYMQRAVLWYSPDCHGKNVRSVCVFGAGDLSWIIQRPEFVVNKFDLSVDYIAYQCVEELLRVRATHSVPWDIEHHKQYIDSHSGKSCPL